MSIESMRILAVVAPLYFWGSTLLLIRKSVRLDFDLAISDHLAKVKIGWLPHVGTAVIYWPFLAFYLGQNYELGVLATILASLGAAAFIGDGLIRRLPPNVRLHDFFTSVSFIALWLLCFLCIFSGKLTGFSNLIVILSLTISLIGGIYLGLKVSRQQKIKKFFLIQILSFLPLQTALIILAFA